MAWLQLQRIITNTKGGANLISPLPRFFSKCSPYVLKVGIPEFLNGIGKGVESHVPKLESEIGDFQKLLVTRTLKLKKLEEVNIEIHTQVQAGIMEATC